MARSQFSDAANLVRTSPDERARISDIGTLGRLSHITTLLMRAIHRSRL